MYITMRYVMTNVQTNSLTILLNLFPFVLKKWVIKDYGMPSVSAKALELYTIFVLKAAS